MFSVLEPGEGCGFLSVTRPRNASSAGQDPLVRDPERGAVAGRAPGHPSVPPSISRMCARPAVRCRGCAGGAGAGGVGKTARPFGSSRLNAAVVRNGAVVRVGWWSGRPRSEDPAVRKSPRGNWGLLGRSRLPEQQVLDYDEERIEKLLAFEQVIQLRATDPGKRPPRLAEAGQALAPPEPPVGSRLPLESSSRPPDRRSQEFSGSAAISCER